MLSSPAMAPLEGTEFEKNLAEVQSLLDQLERLICQQSGDLVGNFEDLLKAGKVKPSKKEVQARYAAQKAREALSDRQAPSKSRLEHNAKLKELRDSKASENDIALVRSQFWNATAEADAADTKATKELQRAKGLLEKVITLRTNSYTRQAQAQAQAQGTASIQARQAQEATDREAREAQESADLKARQAQETADLKARHVQEAADLEARHVQEVADLEARLALRKGEEAQRHEQATVEPRDDPIKEEEEEEEDEEDRRKRKRRKTER